MASTKQKTTKVVARKSAAPKKAVSVSKPAVKKSTKATAKVSKKASLTQQVDMVACNCGTACLPEQAFWINFGPVVSSVAELKGALEAMSDDQFMYHTTRDGNDFARWVRECLHDTKRATQLEKAKTRATAIKALQVCCG